MATQSVPTSERANVWRLGIITLCFSLLQRRRQIRRLLPKGGSSSISEQTSQTWTERRIIVSCRSPIAVSRRAPDDGWEHTESKEERCVLAVETSVASSPSLPVCIELWLAKFVKSRLKPCNMPGKSRPLWWESSQMVHTAIQWKLPPCSINPMKQLYFPRGNQNASNLEHVMH